MAFSTKERASLRGVTHNNLEGLNIDIPLKGISVFSGPSGTGKSSLAHGVFGAISRIRYERHLANVASFSPIYSPVISKATGIPLCVELKQEPLRGASYRSTVSTYTGLLDLLAKLFVRHGAYSGKSVRLSSLSEYEHFERWLSQYYQGKRVFFYEVKEPRDYSTKAQLPKGEFRVFSESDGWVKSSDLSDDVFPGRHSLSVKVGEFVVKGAGSGMPDFLSMGDRYIAKIERENVTVSFENTFISSDKKEPYLPISNRLFLFNSTLYGSGQCPTCGGSGRTKDVPVSLLVPSPRRPLVEGGLAFRQNDNGRYVGLGVLDDIIRGLLWLRGYKNKATWAELDAETRELILCGSGADFIPELRATDARPRSAKRPFKGLRELVFEKAEGKSSAADQFGAYIKDSDCASCSGSRYNRSARALSWRGVSLPSIMHEQSVQSLIDLFESTNRSIDAEEQKLVKPVLQYLRLLQELKLGYLNLSRSISSLSGGEAQRIKLSKTISIEIEDSCYILDEPTRGLHASDILSIWPALRRISDNGNMLLLVEHNPTLIQEADFNVRFSLSSSLERGAVEYCGKPEKYKAPMFSRKSSGNKSTPKGKIEVTGLTINNVQSVGFSIPCHSFTAVMGVSGAGKSSAIIEGLVPLVEDSLAKSKSGPLGKVKIPRGLSFVQLVSQKISPKSSRSTVATYTGLLNVLRLFFARTPLSLSMGMDERYFSFNSLGACMVCNGTGLAVNGFGDEVEGVCHSCGGSRYSEHVLRVKDSSGASIGDILNVRIDILLNQRPAWMSLEAQSILEAVRDLGLGHLALGRSTSSLSVGERQRLGLVNFFSAIASRNDKGLLVLDEPTAGLDIEQSVLFFRRLKDLATESGHSVVVLEHKPEVLGCADWLIEFGPEGGDKGGKIIYEGKVSHGRLSQKPSFPPQKPSKQRAADSVGRQSLGLNESASLVHSLIKSDGSLFEGKDFRGVYPAVSHCENELANGLTIGDILDVHHDIRSIFEPRESDGVFPVKSEDELLDIALKEEFAFSPIGNQKRLGLIYHQDLFSAMDQLSGVGFKEAIIDGERSDITRLTKRGLAEVSEKEFFLVCQKGSDESVVKTALAWSGGEILILRHKKYCSYATHILGEGKIGLTIGSRYIGDRQSSIGQCKLCDGTGRLKKYRLEDFTGNRKKTLAEDGFWDTKVLPYIRGIRKDRILPEAKFLAANNICNFLIPLDRMGSEERLYFEYGLPYRRFLKPRASRSDREQDYISWRGIHDYLYMSLGKMDKGLRDKIVNGFSEPDCPLCQGTGLGWEADQVFHNNVSFLRAFKNDTLEGWDKRLKGKSLKVKQAIQVGLGARRLSDRVESLSKSEKPLLLACLCLSNPLQKLRVGGISKDKRVSTLINNSGMIYEK